MRALFLLAVLALPAARAAILIDRIAVTVGKDVITETEVDQEIRVTAFLNQAPLDFSPTAKRQAAERLVDQDLIRRDMQLSDWPQPEASEAGKILAQLKRSRFANEAQYRQALARYGITENELKQHLLWQLAALRYTDFRFSGSVPPTTALQQQIEQKAEARSAANAQRARTGQEGQIRLGQAREPQPRTDEAGSIGQVKAPAPAPANGHTQLPANIDEQMDAWLKEARARTRIVYHEEAFQ